MIRAAGWGMDDGRTRAEEREERINYAARPWPGLGGGQTDQEQEVGWVGTAAIMAGASINDVGLTRTPKDSITAAAKPAAPLQPPTGEKLAWTSGRLRRAAPLSSRNSLRHSPQVRALCPPILPHGHASQTIQVRDSPPPPPTPIPPPRPVGHGNLALALPQKGVFRGQ